MKTKITLVVAVILVLFGGGYYYFFMPTKTHVPVHRITYLLDVTDAFKITPEPADFVQLFSWDELKQSRITRVRKISNISQDDVYELSLDAYNVRGDLSSWDMMSNDIFRRETIEQYEDSVWNKMNSIYSDTIGYTNTNLLTPMIEELINLQKYTGDDRALAVYSDNTENMPNLSFLRGDTLKLLEADNLSIWNSIPKVTELTNLSGITVYFIYRPRNAIEGIRYEILTSYLKRRLQAYGAAVTVQGKVIHSNIGRNEAE